jgi:hypothetical protein
MQYFAGWGIFGASSLSNVSRPHNRLPVPDCQWYLQFWYVLHAIYFLQVMTFKMAKALSLVTDVQQLLEQGDILFDSEK